jgi:zinc D-Ala-D-Ala carboxypeptidase
MPGASRKGDLSTGHNGGEIPSTLAQGSPNVMTNLKPAARIGDEFEPHPPDHPDNDDGHYRDHGRAIKDDPNNGSPVVKINGKRAARIGDSIKCGDAIAEGSSNVVIGDDPHPIYAVVEPGVVLIGGSYVYANDAVGHAAKKRDETVVANDHDHGQSAPPPPTPTASTTPTTQVPTAPPAAPPKTPAVKEVVTTTDMGKTISKYFTIADAGMVPVDSPEIGLTANQITSNWIALCANILDPLYEKYRFKGSKGKVNSGYRTTAYNRSIGSKDTSDHCKGCAADITLGSKEKNVELFRYIIASGLPFSQVIYEGTWVHIAYKGKPQGVTRVMYTNTGKAPFKHCGQNGSLLPADWNGSNYGN